MLTQLIAFLATIDPVGTLALFIGVTQGLGPEERRRTAVRAVATTAAILFAFLVVGEPLLEALGVSLPAFQLGRFQLVRGIVFFLFGVQMIFGTATGSAADDEAGDWRSLAVYPLAIPSMASPGAILAVVLATRNDDNTIAEQAATAGVLALVLLLTLAVLLTANATYALIGRGGANPLVRLLGLLLASMATQLVVDAVLEIGDV
ncbi:MAG: MarC family protein [Planctomycetota bacterium]